MYEWLKDYQQLENEIAYLEFKIEQIELKFWSFTDESDTKFRNDLTLKKEQQHNILEFIHKFTDTDRQILIMKYVDGMNLEEIAQELNFSVSHIRKKHAELVRTIKFIEGFDKKKTS